MERASKNLWLAKNGATHTSVPRIAKVSHTVEADLAERLETFAFRQRLSESSVIEFALGMIFRRGDDERLGRLLRRNGAARRRRAKAAA